MPTRICLMGDSHAAALRQGWSRIHSHFAQVEMTFFAGSGEEWPGVDISGGRLVPQSVALREQFERSSNGRHEIAGDFDHYIVCGFGLAISFPLRLVTHQGDYGWNEYREAVARHVRESVCASILSKLRQITRAPVLVLATPHQPLDFCKSSPLLSNETAHRLAANFDAECAEMAAEHGAVFLPQPSETLAPNGVTTQMQFANASSVPGREDRRHCNADYGAIVMAGILERLSVPT